MAIYRNPAPTVGSVTPSSGPTSGGTPVTITGTGFQPGAILKISDIFRLTDVAVVSATTITARTPAVSAGTYTLSVTNPDYQYGELHSAFSFANLPGYS